MTEFSENEVVFDTSNLRTSHCSSHPQPLLFTDKETNAKKKKKIIENKGHKKLKDLAKNK